MFRVVAGFLPSPSVFSHSISSYWWWWCRVIGGKGPGGSWAEEDTAWLMVQKGRGEEGEKKHLAGFSYQHPSHEINKSGVRFSQTWLRILTLPHLLCVATDELLTSGPFLLYKIGLFMPISQSKHV